MEGFKDHISDGFRFFFPSIILSIIIRKSIILKWSSKELNVSLNGAMVIDIFTN